MRQGPTQIKPVVFLTGASGMLGGALVPVLTAAGYEVISHGRAPEVGTGPAFPLERLELIEPAVRDYRPDWIVHAAAQTSLDACEQDARAAQHLHVEASAELARAAGRYGARLLYVSTDSVYDGEKIGAHDEDEELRPLNCYARTKLEGEQACLAALRSTLVARVNFVGWNARRRQGLLHWLATNLRAGITVNGFTDVWFNPLPADALAESLALAMRHSLPGGIYNFGAADHCSKYEFARRVARRLGVDEALVRPQTLAAAALCTPRPRNTVTATAKLAAALGRSLPTINEGLDRLGAMPEVILAA